MDGNPPKQIIFESQVFDLTFHPKENLVAAGLLSGDVFCYKYSVEEKNELKFHSNHHNKSCRTLQFSENGDKLFTASLDKSIVSLDVETGKIVYQQEEAHDNPINRILRLNENLLASGDDDGIVKLWDLRKKKTTMEWQENDDFISDMKYVPEKKNLLVSGADGYFSVFDIRKKDVYARSDNLDDELLSITLVKNKSKVIVGTQEGILNIFSYGSWGDVSDRFPGHPQSIDALCTIDEETICTGSSDGLIRVISILPNKLVGVIGDHGDYPIERLQLSHDNKFMGSCSHDNSIKFWDIDYFFNDDGEDEENDEENADEEDEDENEDEDDEEGASSSLTKKKGKRPLSDSEDEDENSDESKSNQEGEWEDDSDDDDDSDDSDNQKQKKKKSKKAKRGIGGISKSSSTSSFFAGID